MPSPDDRLDAERWRRIDAVLDRVLDAGRAEWPALVAEACGDDADLRREVEGLLAGYGAHEAVLATGAGAVAAALLADADADRQADALVGARLGPWRVVRQVGQGGMARVFLGERADGAFAQRVAVKVLRAGLDTPADVERFRAERQILASLDHPNIARLLDGGVAPDGRPYLVLEYVEGEPLTAYCDARGLDVRARLALFLAVAEATQAAHRQLVVHRDLKPSNILVGADGRPRLLDFGIAKILDPGRDPASGAAGDGAPPTTARGRWLTPDYAAPEQFTGAPATTATDVYQLGAVLYELLSGRRPFDAPPGAAGRDARYTPDTIETRVLHEDPPPPSAHAAAPATPGGSRRLLPARRGDLDAVALKALRKEPGARYATVAELAADVRRALDGEPVAARAGERAYRWRRQARRHALALSLAAAAVVAIGAYVATLVVQNGRIARALAQARAERAAADVERATSEQVTRFLLGLFQASDPRPGGGRADTVSARTLLARGEARAAALAGQPAVQAEMLGVIGRVQADLGALPEARATLGRALAVRRRLLGDSHPDVAASVAVVAQLDHRAARYADAVRGYGRALAVQRARLGDTAAATQRTVFELATALHSSGRLREAEPLFAEWERHSARRPRTRDAAYAAQLDVIGDYLVARAVFQRDTAARARAERYYREALAVRREVLGARHADVASSARRVAWVTWARGNAREGEALFREALATYRAVHPDGHPDLVVPLSEFGSRLSDDGRHAEAIPLVREAAALARRFHGADNLLTGAALHRYGDTLLRAGERAAAERVLRDAVALFRRAAGDGNLMTARARITLAAALRDGGRTGEAEALLRGVFARLRADRGEADAQTQVAVRALVALHEDAGRPAEAARWRARLAPVPVPGGEGGQRPAGGGRIP